MGLERALRFAQVGVLAICIGVPPILFGLGSRSAAIDNRAPTPRPAVSGTKLLDTAVTDQFDDFPQRRISVSPTGRQGECAVRKDFRRLTKR